MRKLLTILLLSVGVSMYAGKVVSPNGKLSVKTAGHTLTVNYQRQPVMVVEMSSDLSALGKSKPVRIEADYQMVTGKRLHCKNEAYEYRAGALVLRLYNDGIAFRYEGTEGVAEKTSARGQSDKIGGTAGDYGIAYRIAEGTKRWMQQWCDSYEGFFPLSTTYKVEPVPSYSGISKSAEGWNNRWGYPALLEPQKDVFVLITEANIEHGQSASCLINDGELFRVVPAEGIAGKTSDHTPWRVAIIGALKDVVESTLVTDVSEPCRIEDTSWIEPGTVSWIYWAYNHGSNDYNIIKKYVDMADVLRLPYVLIDAEWDEMNATSHAGQGSGKDGKTIEDAVNYAKARGVKPLIWYNSSVGWVNGAPGPKFRLNKPEDREKEFAWCEKIGVAGVKIDFFSGDTQLNMDYCIDLLESAARHHLLVNFHGATIPRGWQRTYPNLMSTEGVYGAEWYNNVSTFTNKAARHNATLPFTRNVIGPMDYTPCTFSDSQHPHITTHAHELALTVLFESGLQHLADRPESYLSQPKEVQQFLTELPAAWDETRFVSGYPGEQVVLARRHGATWYIAGINGSDEAQTLRLPLDFLGEKRGEVLLFTDNGERSFAISNPKDLPQEITCQPRGGFVMVVKSERKLTVRYIAPNAVRIQYGVPDTKSMLPDWLYVKHGEVQHADVTATVEGNVVLVKDKAGRVVFRATRHELENGVATLAFDSPKDESLFGLGQFQDGYSNVRGLSRRLTQVNTQISIPMLLSSKGYGVLWNNYGLTEFNPCSEKVILKPQTSDLTSQTSEVVNVTSTEGGKQEVRRRNRFTASLDISEDGAYALLLDVGQKMARRHNLTIDGKTVIEMQNLWLPPTASAIVSLSKGAHVITAELSNGDQPVLYYNKVKDETVFRSPVAEAVDYTVFVGSPDEIIASYRDLTGRCPQMPSWALGYIHCRERFHSSEEILQTANRFRKEQLPVSVMVQDWQYWGKHGWNSMQFDEDYYPDPKALTDSLHKMDMRLMLSVWSKIDKNSDVGRQMLASNYYIPNTDWIDFFNPDAAAAYWKNFSERLVPLGIDAWWQDATEPENDDLVGRHVNNGRWSGEQVRNVYPLLVCKTVSEGLTGASGISGNTGLSVKAPMILTRSGFPGIQRYGVALWSGDVGNDWETFRRQLVGGLGMQAAGIPWWTYDAGGFFRPQNQYKDEAYVERMLRWIETAVYLPLMRVHGYMSDTEPWNYGPDAQAIIADCLKERYRLLPYIERCARAVSEQGGTLMRPLVFDFADDAEALKQPYEYMFGPALLVSPVTEPGVTSWRTYLPKHEGGWYDYRTGQHYDGGQYVTTSVTKAFIPVFRRAGYDIDIPLVYGQEHTGSHYAKPALPTFDELPEIRELPDPLKGVSSFSDWERKRQEIATQIQHYGIGEKPAVSKEQVKARMDGDTLIVDVTVNGETLTLRSEIRYPKTGTAPYAVMIGTSGIALPRKLFDDRPIATMVFHEKQVNDYGQWGKHHERGEHNFDRLYPHLKDNGAYSEWAWGLSRLIDGLQLLGPEVTKIDVNHIGVTGCSYAGKMALYCGAFDERVALTIAQEPGGGGAAAWRKSHESKEKVEDIDKTDYHWFKESQRDNFRGDSVYHLPYDQHELCALVCPRALLLLGNPDYPWLSDPAMLASAEAAVKVWERFGIADRMDWSIVDGHGHCQLPESQWPEVEAFIDKFLLGRQVETGNVRKYVTSASR